ncbi:helix-turn-helix transcriptional regulator [Actinomadura litoris]|uniref:helix-turn-helix transcriptional regulator n=1 Tax=Actinomadura litoris TaxID=2678616 RepID=UPI0035563438
MRDSRGVGRGGRVRRGGPARRYSAHARLLTVREITDAYGIPRGTVSSWVARGHLKPFARQGGRTRLYRESDVLACERDRARTCGSERSAAP